MRRSLLLAAGCLLLAAPTSAQVNLAWNKCITQSGASIDKSYLCNGSETGTYDGVISFIAPANVTAFGAVDAIVDIFTNTASLPDFWRMGTGECRAANLSITHVVPGIGTGTTGTCQSPFEGTSIGYGLNYASGVPSAPHARVEMIVARSTGQALVQDQQYLGVIFRLSMFKDVNQGNGVCAGCSTPACLVVNQITLQQIPPASPASFVLASTATRNFVTWQGGTPSCTAATPVPNHTWGAIKSVYR
jgi:hypothetical protein